MRGRSTGVRSEWWIMVALWLLGTLAAPAARAADYPDRPVEFTVPFSAGGGSDIMARTIATIMEQEKLFPQPLVVVNRPGANGVLGYLHVGQKVGDPYLLTTAAPSLLVQGLLGRMKLSHRDYTLVAGLALDEFVLVVPAASPYRTVGDLVEAARRAPRSVKAGGTGIPGSDAIIAHLLEEATGAQLNYIAFRSGGEAMTNLLGGHIDLTTSNPGEALAQIQAKRVRAIATVSQRRLPSFPDVPTLREQGIDVVLTQWRGVAAPAGLPKEAEAALVGAFRRLSESPAWARYLRENDLTPLYMGPEEFGRYLDGEAERLGRILRKMGALK